MKATVQFIPILLGLLLGCGQRHGQFFQVKQGDFQATITETGELQAVNSRVLVMPWLGWKYGRPKIAQLINEGAQVKIGDQVGQIETFGIMKFLKQKENELNIAKADLRKLEVELASRQGEHQSQLASAQAAFNLAKIQAEKIKFESARSQTISGLKLEKARFALEKVQQNIVAEKIQRVNELKIQQLTIFKLENEVKDANRALQKAVLVTPLNGLVEYKRNRRTREKVRAGDELWPGAPILGIPDLSQMKVKATINEADITKINLAQKVMVRLDAFPKQPFEGKLIFISKLCHEKEDEPNLKLFDIEILLDRTEPILKPGMTVSCEILTTALNDVVYIENECVVKEAGRYFVWIKKGTGVEKREIGLGPRNNKYSVIATGLKPGEYVAGVAEVKSQEPGNAI
ncbi:efflux RND transporter periplasmic adaptor subunit [candidate division KSB1 bacterium]|nr:efflux RND transporter periplasmic adaptor subunit [candidate division KSB1 bacterium]